MARKKQDIALQVEIETQEEWEEMLAKEGLTGKLEKHAWISSNLYGISFNLDACSEGHYN